MLSWRWGGALKTALVAAPILLLACRREEAAVGAASTEDVEMEVVDMGLVLAGYLEAPGIDPTRCEVRCTSMRLEPGQEVHLAPLDPEGRFVLTGLSDVDYCVEVVVRSNPSLVVARMEFVRPDGDELVIESDPSVLFGPAASPFGTNQ